MKNTAVEAMVLKNFNLDESNQLNVEFSHTIGTTETYNVSWWKGEREFSTTIDLTMSEVEEKDYTPEPIAT